MPVQSIIFSAEQWTFADAYRWVLLHGYKPTKKTLERNHYRFRIRDPGQFRTFYTQVLNHDGKHINLVIGNPVE